MPERNKPNVMTLVTWSYDCPCGRRHNCTYSSDEDTAEANGLEFRRMCVRGVGSSRVSPAIIRHVNLTDVCPDIDYDEMPF